MRTKKRILFIQKQKRNKTDKNANEKQILCKFAFSDFERKRKTRNTEHSALFFILLGFLLVICCRVNNYNIQHFHVPLFFCGFII